MSQELILKRQLLFIKALRKKPSTQKEIISYILANDSEIGSIDRNMFTRDRKAIENIWNLEIEYHPSTKQYSIEQNFNQEIINRLINSYDIIYVLNKIGALNNKLFLEKTDVDQTQCFNSILDAIESKKIIQFQLNSYEKEISKRKCVPIAIKEASNRWYVIGYDLDKKDFRNYGLDRISSFRMLEERYTPPPFDVNIEYANVIGIERNGYPKNILLRFDNDQKKYLESLPFHTSQKIENETTDTFDVKLFLHLTYELKMKILEYGEYCEVLEPDSLRQELKFTVAKLYKKYEL